MKSFVATATPLLLLTSAIANAGVVMEMVTTNAAGQETDRTKIYAQSKKIRMEQGGDNASKGTMIFLGDRFLYVDHEDKSYVVMDEEMLDEVSTQMDAAMKEMEAQLANMPPEQRAMVEQMMKGQMQGMMGEQDDATPALRVESIGSGKWQSNKCQKYAVYQGATKTQEVCAAALDDVDGAEELFEAFRNMAAYITKLTESLPMRGDERPNPVELMDQIDGFPAHTIDYDNGVVVSEVSLESVAEQDLNEELFAAPKGYRRQDPFARR